MKIKCLVAKVIVLFQIFVLSSCANIPQQKIPSKDSPKVKTSSQKEIVFYVVDHGFGSFLPLIMGFELDPKIKSIAIQNNKYYAMLSGNYLCETQFFKNVMYATEKCREAKFGFKDLIGMGFNSKGALCGIEETYTLYCENEKGEMQSTNEFTFSLNPGLDEMLNK